MPKEIELKFLLNRNVEIKGKHLNSYNILQGYLSIGKNLVTRSRFREDTNANLEEGFLTVKSTGSGISRDEYEYIIHPEDAKGMIADADSSVSKTRNVVLIDDHHFEIDTFTGALDYLSLVEVEFPSQEAALAFDASKYPFLGKDVSHDKSYSNYDLSLIRKTQTINIKTDFSKCPFGRYITDGDNSGERFREDFLVPALNEKGLKTILNFKGLEGFLSSGFIEESFGGLVRNHHVHPMDIFGRFDFVNIEDDILSDIHEFVMDMSDFTVVNEYVDSPSELENMDIIIIVYTINDGEHYNTLHMHGSKTTDPEARQFLMETVYREHGLVDSIEVQKILR